MLPTPEAMRRWELLRPWLQRALRYAPAWVTEEEVRGAVQSGEASVAIARSGERWEVVLVLEVREYPSGRRLAHVWLLSGRRGALRAARPVVEEYLDRWSRAHGCDTITLEGRRGWGRALAPRWQQQPMTVMYRAVTP